MKKWELNGLGKNYVYEANDPIEATMQLMQEICGAKTVAEYCAYCDSVGVTSKIEWTEYTE